ncbi:hypothetical protein RND81_09G178200 [Saponaria officinalis]|uniref:EEF1A lysine methyltransferase 4 n=1 Tax=Saponaria officinalis TaxID=3572 RepID=A0AAW1IM66_SAPOF
MKNPQIKSVGNSTAMESKMQQSKKEKEEVAPPTASTYLDPLYWNQRFAKEEHYEWFKDYSHFRHLLLRHIPSSSSVLEVGCGNSQLSDEMYKDGITDITCTDLSPVAVQNLQNRVSSKGFKEIKAMVADMLDLPFGDATFDVVIEKGTMDVLFVDSGDPWNPQAETVRKVMAMLHGIHRVLKPDGIFISISFGQPHFRRPIFEAPDFTWSMKWNTFGDGFHYFFYTLKKGTRSLISEQPNEKLNLASICLFQDELEGEDYIFRTNLGDSEEE